MARNGSSGGKKNRQKPISDEDRKLFRDSVGPLRRLRRDHAPSSDVPTPRPVPTFSRADEQEVIGDLLKPTRDPELGESFYAQPGLQTKTIRTLKRGQFRIDAELDLHAMTENAARRALIEFISECQQEGARCIRVVHGKGLRSGTDGPVIKPMVERELERRDQVLAFCSARPVHGGSGAVYVLLRKG